MAAHLGYSERTLLADRELISTFLSKLAPEHQIVHLELSAMHEPLMIVLECLAVPHIFNSGLPSSLIDEVDVIMPELVLHGFIICLDTEGAHGDLRGEDDLSPIHQEEGCLSSSLTG
jgi:hypothetical protein